MLRTIIKTADGSHSLFVEGLNEHYHSIHGAIQESKHVFIEAGLKPFISGPTASSSEEKEHLSILEIGLGTGLNAILTYIETQRSDIHIHYTAIEAYPVSPDLIDQLNYVELLKVQNLQAVYSSIHACEWGRPFAISDQFTILKINNALQDTVLENNYHLIYFDAFGPGVQPEMWTQEIFAKLYAVVEPGGCLVTYCAKGEVKRTLKRVGFTVESLPGPPGKREMVRASKN
ncbi:MAG: tRNA (5-methylaminomethyl-2-thiouridine)(34)-methyltransferase MnmD [Bacteroidetes bacterium]|nr:tRNA (5-methylaminomethyl-2-thiouridine)(34)-methyltransferase MnmD [Bacteroidota bacterium]